MIFELLAASMINADFNLIAQANDKPKAVTEKTAKKSAINIKFPMTQAFVLPEDNNTKLYNFYEVTQKFQNLTEPVIKDFSARKNDQKQFLKWVDLPSEQLAKKGTTSHLDEIYDQANMLKNRKGDVERPLVVLGIGGSKHTAEFLLNMNGVGNKGKVYFYSDIDPISYENFLKEVNRPIN